jgi:adenylate cyclase
MLVGNFGSKQIFNYTVIGDHVNLGSRLIGLNNLYLPSNRIIISEFTRNKISDKFVTREIDCVRVKGKEKAIAIFELVGDIDGIAYPEGFLTHFNEGFVRYKKREFRRALGEFKKALVLFEDSVCKLYINRCEHYMKNPPPGSDWDGVFTSTTR